MNDRWRKGRLEVVQNGWWSARTPLEKVGVVALTVTGAAVAAVVLFPHAAAAASGGALTATGACLLRKGFGT